MSTEGEDSAIAQTNTGKSQNREENSQIDSAQAIKDLAAAISVLANNKKIDEVAKLVDEVPTLRQQLDSKHKDAESLRRDIAQLQAEHHAAHLKHLDLYRASHAQIEKTAASLTQEVSRLKAELGDKSRIIKAQQGKETDSRAELQQVRESLRLSDEALKKSHSRVSESAKDVNAARGHVENLKGALQKEKEAGDNLRKVVSRLEQDHNIMKRDIQMKQVKLSDILGFAATLNKEDFKTTVPRLDGIWRSAHGLVQQYFYDDLTPEALENQELWKRLKDLKLLQHSVPLPRSNSAAAKQMRIAVLLALLARTIDTHIFQPTYILGADSDIRQIMLRVAILNSRKESFCRGMMLSIFPMEQTAILSEQARQVVMDITWVTRNLLSETRAESFRSALEQLVQDSCNTWLITQRLQDKFEPSFELTSFEHLEWQPLRFEGEPKSKGMGAVSGQAVGHDELLIVFPRVYVVSDDEPDPVSEGVALKRSQVIEATVEVERERVKSPTFGRTILSRSKTQQPRRMSVHAGDSDSGGLTFLGNRGKSPSD